MTKRKKHRDDVPDSFPYFFNHSSSDPHFDIRKLVEEINEHMKTQDSMFFGTGTRGGGKTAHQEDIKRQERSEFYNSRTTTIYDFLVQQRNLVAKKDHYHESIMGREIKEAEVLGIY
jgi:hypothetical protein